MDNEYKIRCAGELMQHFNSDLSSGHCFLAGGAVRDALNKKPIKDLDFFVPENFNTNFSSSLGFDFGSLTLTKLTDEEYAHPEIQNVVKGYYKGVEFNLIRTNCDPELFITKHFDIGLCMCYIDPNGKLHLTKDYQNDLVTRTITATIKQSLSGAMRDKIVGHAKRIQNKYPDFQYIIRHMA